MTSVAQALPNPGRFYRHYLPLYPVAVELFDLDEYDLVHQQQPLRGEIGGDDGQGRARLLLPLADAVCLGSVRRLLRSGSGWSVGAAGCFGR